MKKIIICVSFLMTYNWALAQDDGHNHDGHNHSHHDHHHKAKLDSVHKEQDKKDAERGKKNVTTAEGVVKEYVEKIPMRFEEVEARYVSYSRNPLTGKNDVKKVIKKKLYSRGIEILYKDWKEKFDFETDVERRMLLGDELMLLLGRMRDLSKENTTELELKLSKTDKADEIKRLLGLE